MNIQLKMYDKHVTFTRSYELSIRQFQESIVHNCQAKFIALLLILIIIIKDNLVNDYMSMSVATISK